MAPRSFNRAHAEMLLGTLPMLLRATDAPAHTLEAHRAFTAAVPDLPDAWLAAALRDVGAVARTLGRSIARSLGKPTPRAAAGFDALTAALRKHTPPRPT